MSRYIDAEPIQKFIENRLNNPDKEKAFGYDAVEILAEIEYAPTADVKPVVRGEWVAKNERIRSITAKNYYCSICKCETAECLNYCGNCGADMRGDVDD